MVDYVPDRRVLLQLHREGLLRAALSLPSTRWMLAEDIREEARRGGTEGRALLSAIDELVNGEKVVIAFPDPQREGRFAQRLQARLGRSEAAAIALAWHQQRTAVLADPCARRVCDLLQPPVAHVNLEHVRAALGCG